MQINKISNISSKGMALKAYAPRYKSISEHSITETSRYIGNIIGQPTSAVEKIIIGANQLRLKFLKDLAKKYNIRNHNLPYSQKEDSTPLLDIYEHIEYPEPAHFDILRKSKEGFENIKQIFTMAEDTKSLDFVLNLQRNILKESSNPSRIIIDLLESKNKQDYINNLTEFESYLRLNANKKDAVIELDSFIQTNKFDRKKYDSMLAVKKLLQHKNINKFAGDMEDVLVKNYTKERSEFLKVLTADYLARKTNLQNLNKNLIAELYNSTTAENYELRISALNKFRLLAKDSKDGELSEIKKLFANIDNNQDAKKFIINSINRNLPVSSVKELNIVIDATDLYKANYFFNNVKRIVALSEGQERLNALKTELENPFFEPKEKIKSKVLQIHDDYTDNGIINKTKKYLLNKIDIFIFKHLAKKPENIVKTEVSTEKSPFKTLTQERKIKLSKEVDEIIKNKLGKRTYNEQEDIYRLKVTKIRISLLPEIFKSIKDTRAQAKAKLLMPASSNRDTARLYELINGKNKKIVRYMLTKTDNNGNRIFDVKQIIDYIEKANEYENSVKKINSKYNAQSSKLYYENLFMDLTQKYGK